MPSLRVLGLVISIAATNSGCDSSTSPAPETPPSASAPASAPAPVPPLVEPLPAPTPPTRIPVAFVVMPGAEVVDFAGPWGVFEYVFLPDHEEPVFQLFTVSEKSEPVKVSGGMTIVPDYTFADAPMPKVIVVPAQNDPTPAELEWLRRASKSTDVTMSVCNGAFVLGEAGLLDGKEATAHHNAHGLFAATFPEVRLRRGARFVDAQGVSTAGGLTSGIDLALHTVERYFGRAVAEHTATALEYQGTGWMDPDSNVAFANKPVSTPGHPICPVCEMEVDEDSAQVTHRGETIRFCSAACQETFAKYPERFVGSDEDE
ncbi:DJ-1/PfpI family protein [Nannocystaceae bacterium ST9]